MKIIIGKGGQVRFIYTDELTGLLKEGTAKIRRASNVEPGKKGWLADLSPVLGPFTKRGTALNEEVNWLLKHRIPVPK